MLTLKYALVCIVRMSAYYYVLFHFWNNKIVIIS